MLRFQGIWFVKGVPERFQQRYEIYRYAHEVGKFLESYHEPNQALKAVECKINRLYGSFRGNTLSSVDKKEVFLLHRMKDLLYFLTDQDTAKQNVKRACFYILKSPESIEEKWAKIVTLIFCSQDLFFKVGLEKACSEKDSFLMSIVKCAQIFFLEQIPEGAPQNMSMTFIPKKFPEYNWTLGAEEDREFFADWEPRNHHGRLSYLLVDIAQKYSQKNGNIFPETPQDSPLLKNQSEDKVETSIHYEEIDLNFKQFSLFDEEPIEVLFRFQNMILKKYKVYGLLHFFAVMRQLAYRRGGTETFFNFDFHLALIGKKNKKGFYAKKQRELAENILNEMTRLDITRTYPNLDYEEQNQLISIIGRRFNSLQKNSFGYMPEVRLLVDRFFLPGTNRKFHAGTPLLLIPKGIFQEKAANGLMPLLSAFFAGIWLYEYGKRRGTVTKTAAQIIEGIGLEVPKSGKYRIIYNLKDTLQKMKEQSYIKSFIIEPSVGMARNPWQDTYKVFAPKEVLGRIESLYRQQILPSS